MRANSMCISCMLSKQEKLIREFRDEDKKTGYMHEVLGILHQYGCTESAPRLAEKINQLYETYWSTGEDYASLKHQYNTLLREKEHNIIQRIKASTNCLLDCIKYASVGNYIDFSAVENVNEDTFTTLLERANTEHISEKEFACFQRDLEQAETLVYLTDNCGEIVLDKILIQFIQELYPQIKITVIVRGKSILNDATMEDAKQALTDADVIISKGQGNFESMVGEGFNPYYIFLCKCELFVRRFGLKQYEAVFIKEERLNMVTS